MKEFEPSADFLSSVMKSVRGYESAGNKQLRFPERLLSSKPFRYALSGGGIFLGIFLSPIVCI